MDLLGGRGEARLAHSPVHAPWCCQPRAGLWPSLHPSYAQAPASSGGGSHHGAGEGEIGVWGAQEWGSRQLGTQPGEMERDRGRRDYVGVEAPRSCCMLHGSIKFHSAFKSKGKKNFETATTGIKPQSWALLSIWPSLTARVSRPCLLEGGTWAS